MDTEKNLYDTSRIKKVNSSIKDENIVFEQVSLDSTPVARKPKISYPRQSRPAIEKPSSPAQSRSIDSRTVSKEYDAEGRQIYKNGQSRQEYSKPSSRPRQTRPENARPVRSSSEPRPSSTLDSKPDAVRPTNPSQARKPYRPSDENRPHANNAQRRPQSSTSPRRDSNALRAEQNPIKAPRNLKKSGFKGFKKFLTIYSAALLVVVIVVMIILSSFVKNYEKNQPSNLAANIATELSTNPKAYLDKHKDKINCLENVDAIIEKAVENIGESKLSFIENRNYRADAPSFDFISEDYTVARVTFEQDKKGAFGLNTWKVKSLEIAEFIPNTISYTLLAPEGTSVTINDKPITDAYKTLDAQIPENLQVASKYVEIPLYVTYKVSGFTATPSVKATDANGTELGTTITSDTIVVGATTTQEFIDSVKGRVENAIEDWAKHFISYGGYLRDYIYYDCDWYAYIFGSDEIDPIATQFYDYEYIGSIEFPVKEAKNYIRYTDHCFTVDVQYEMQVNFTTDRLHDENQKLNATWVWFYDDKSEEWYIVDCIYK